MMPSRNTPFSCNRHRISLRPRPYQSTLFGTLTSLQERSISEFSGYLLYLTTGLLMWIYCSDDCKKNWTCIFGHNSGGDGRIHAPHSSQDGCSRESCVLFGPRNWAGELYDPICRLINALPISDLQKSEFRKISIIRHFHPSNRHDHGLGKEFILIGYLSYATAEDFVEVWKEYGEKDVEAIILGREWSLPGIRSRLTSMYDNVSTCYEFGPCRQNKLCKNR